MAKDQGVKMPAAGTAKRPTRAAQVAKSAAVAPAGGGAGAAPAAQAKPRTSPAKFWQEVRAEGRKISWPSWKETWITSVMVFIMVAVTATFFLVVNSVLNFGLQQLLRIAGS